MKIHSLIQGSPEWRAYRAQHFNASDAPAMMGVSPYKTRAALLRELHSGVVPDVDVGTQKRYDNGHRAEALARPLAEEFIGAELYPVTGSEGRLSASFDGLTLDESECFEHKALNAELRRAIQDEGSGPQLPIYHRAQMEQQLLISGARRALFMASEWEADKSLIEERHCWYYPDLKLRQQIVDGWTQFERDLAAYALPEQRDEPAPVGKSPQTLPALRIEVTGQVTASNLAEFKATALAAIRGVNRTLENDRDFADAEMAVKWCSEVEIRLAAAKEHALSQTTSIDELFKAIDDIGAEARRVRLDLNALVTRRKVEVKEAEVNKTREALAMHVEVVNVEITPAVLRYVAPFGDAIKGLKTLDSVRAKLDAALAAAKIEVDGKARAIRANLAAYRERAAGFEFLFADLGTIAHKGVDDFILLVQARIDAHKAAEERRRAEAAEAERRRQEAAAAEAQRKSAAALEAAQRQPAAAPPAASAAQPRLQPAPAPRIAAPPPRADEPATLNLGTICSRLGFTVSAAFLADTLHIQPARVEKAARLYRESQFALICAQLQSHVSAMAELYAGEPA